MGYELIWEPPGGIVKRHFGGVTGQELLAAVLATEGDRRFDALRYVINDFTDCTGLSVADSELEEIAAIDRAAHALNARIRIAIVATLPEAVAAGSAYAGSPLNRYETRVFATMREARDWLASAVS
ncbi:MAG: hypothetical protein HGA75_08230 [Thiobacillus sp.]|nr:hypothetical protein [Thiobacillus sp.]